MQLAQIVHDGGEGLLYLDSNCCFITEKIAERLTLQGFCPQKQQGIEKVCYDWVLGFSIL
jgi:hypothetical protein